MTESERIVFYDDDDDDEDERMRMMIENIKKKEDDGGGRGGTNVEEVHTNTRSFSKPGFFGGDQGKKEKIGPDGQEGERESWEMETINWE